MGSEVRQFPNPEGIPDLLRQLPPGAVVGLEATGVYGRPLAFALHRSGFRVYVLNPLAVKSYARSLLRRAKTDRADARLIARFLAERHADLEPYEPTEDVLYQWVSWFASLGGWLLSVCCSYRLHAWEYAWPDGLGLVRQVPDVLVSLRREVEAMALSLLETDSEAWRHFQALQGLPGVGPSIALTILAYSGDLRRFRSARAYAAYTGLTPRLYQSGQLPERASISRMGPSALRAAFWMAALSASRVEPYASLVARLVQSGKPKKVAITAVANRLARAAWAVVVKGGT